MPEDRLELVNQHVAEGPRIVVAERERIAKLKVLARDRADQDALLDEFERTLFLIELELGAPQAERRKVRPAPMHCGAAAGHWVAPGEGNERMGSQMSRLFCL